VVRNTKRSFGGNIMARYIRTKDGVYEVSHLNAYATHKRKGETLLEGYKTSYIKNENIIAQSENLEELCDEFVIDNWKERGKPVYCFKYVKETKTAYCIDGGGYITLFIPKMLECGCIIKGAIYTGKGLIYVAKMNEKGELELL
jgi:hypothetical protein